MGREGEIMNVRGVASGPLFGPEYGTELYIAMVKSTSPYRQLMLQITGMYNGGGGI